MRHRKKIAKFGLRGAHRKSLFANQVSSLILNGEIQTTIDRAKETRRIAEKMVTFAKKGDLHHRRLAISKIKDKIAVKKLFAELGTKFADRKGGYTRILRLGARRGDSAEMAILKWVDDQAAAPVPKKEKSKKTEKKSPEKAEKAAETTVSEK